MEGMRVDEAGRMFLHGRKVDRSDLNSQIRIVLMSSLGEMFDSLALEKLRT